MASTTFKVNQYKCTIRTTKTKRPTGLASVVWTDPGPQITIIIVNYNTNPFQDIKETFKDIGCLIYRRDRVAWAIGSTKYWKNFNTLNGQDCAEINKKPFTLVNIDIALLSMKTYIIKELEKL